MAVWDVGLWLNLHYYQCQPHLICRWHLVSLVWGILWYRLCCLNRLTSEGLEAGRQQHKYRTQGLSKPGLDKATSNKTGCAGEEEGRRQNRLVAWSCPELISTTSMAVRTIPYLTVGMQVIVRLNPTGDHDLLKGKSNNIKAIKAILQELLNEILWLKENLRLD